MNFKLPYFFITPGSAHKIKHSIVLHAKYRNNSASGNITCIGHGNSWWNVHLNKVNPKSMDSLPDNSLIGWFLKEHGHGTETFLINFRLVRCCVTFEFGTNYIFVQSITCFSFIFNRVGDGFCPATKFRHTLKWTINLHQTAKLFRKNFNTTAIDW